jgi:NAD(P)H dehydrogenase (quinone)
MTAVRSSQGPLQPCLKHITKIGVVTTYGAPLSAALWCGDGGRSILANTWRENLAPDCQVQWECLREMDHRTPEEHAQFIAHVEKSFARF